MTGMCSGVTSSAVSGDGGASSRSTPESWRTRTCWMRSMSIDGAVTTSTMLLRSRPEVEEDPVVAELEVAVDEGDLAARARDGARSPR